MLKNTLTIKECYQLKDIPDMVMAKWQVSSYLTTEATTPFTLHSYISLANGAYKATPNHLFI